MSSVRQISLISAGCQPWNLNVVDSTGSRFAYAATLAIYIYEWDPESNQFYLHSIMSEHKKTISAIAWNLKDKDILASSSTDFKICVWHVTKRKKPQTHVKLGGGAFTGTDSVSWLLWDPFSQNYLLICTANGRLQLIDSSTDVASVITTYSLPSKAVTIKCAAWLTEAPGAFVTGEGHGNLGVMVEGWCVMSSSLLPLKIHRAEGLMHVKFLKDKSPSVGAVWEFGDGIPAQVPFSSLDYGSKL
ncbi:WD repeat-containing protein 17 [Trichonephila clavipes]|nr:WD repeat-containing protein 17 [Trichonephila clavipes]